jgi:hypothetical protein
MTARSDLRSAMSRSQSLPWGTSAVVFCLAADRRALAAEDYFQSRKVPAVFVVYDLAGIAPEEGLSFNSKVHLMHRLGYEGGR